ncbi:sensor histidine kinase [Vibrio sp. 10N.261.51.F12]|uniref:sensor histidine kinase n=1 Tax=Vibrio sp. 10N.261.51.F12 TaxID=3229679 RepID=UPI00354F4227
MMALKRCFKTRKTNSVRDVRARLIIIFSVIALSSAFLVFLAFSLYLAFNEDSQIERHLVSFERTAVQHYSLEAKEMAHISPHIVAYYSDQALSDTLKAQRPYPIGIVTRYKSFSEDGFMVYHTQFVDNSGVVRPLYLSINARAMEFGDDNGSVLILISMGLMFFLIAFLRFALLRVFEGLMSPISDLGLQLKATKTKSFAVSSHAIDEVKQLTKHLNRYTQMKDRVVKQELMFAKYASHELKTPIAIILGAANLQAMKDDQDFQIKQRRRIINAAEDMQATVEVLLNIVKQENTEHKNTLSEFSSADIDLHQSLSKRHSGVQFTLKIMDNTRLNFPPTVLNMLLKNLVDNAVRFTESGEICVEVSEQLITVQDSGCGVGVNNETEHGLGLLIVRRLCTSYGWSFSLSNNKAQAGCTARLERRFQHEDQ